MLHRDGVDVYRKRITGIYTGGEKFYCIKVQANHGMAPSRRRERKAGMWSGAGGGGDQLAG